MRKGSNAMGLLQQQINMFSFIECGISVRIFKQYNRKKCDFRIQEAVKPVNPPKSALQKFDSKTILFLLAIDIICQCSGLDFRYKYFRSDVKKYFRKC